MMRNPHRRTGPRDDYRHCATEGCWWFMKGIAHVGPCFISKPPREQSEEYRPFERTVS
jgi:hypothetical protein